MRVGIVVLNWNGRHLLAECLDSVLADDFADKRLIVVDNASEDGSVAWLRERYPSIEVIVNDRNLRFAGGNNVGARVAIESGCELVLLLNNDAQLESGALAQLAAAFEADPALGVAGPRIVYADRPDRIWFGGGIARLGSGRFAHRAIRRSTRAGADPAGATDWVTGCALASRAELYQQLNGLDEAFYIYGEDVDFALRARAKGWRIGYVPQAVVRHAVSASVGGRRSAFKVYHQARSRRQLIERHADGIQRGVALLCSLGQDLSIAAALAVTGQGRAAAAVLHGFWDAPRGVLRHPVP